MGLDAWVGQVRRVGDDVADFVSKRFSMYAPSDVLVLDVDAPMSDAVRDLCREVESYGHDVDYDLIRRDFGVPDGWHNQMYSVYPGGMRFRYVEDLTKTGDEDASIEFEVSDDEFERRYETIVRTPVLLLGWADVAYWRKDERVRAIAKRRHKVENCGCATSSRATSIVMAISMPIMSGTDAGGCAIIRDTE